MLASIFALLLLLLQTIQAWTEEVSLHTLMNNEGIY